MENVGQRIFSYSNNVLKQLLKNTRKLAPSEGEHDVSPLELEQSSKPLLDLLHS